MLKLAYYDPTKDQIVGTTKVSLGYYHELGHRDLYLRGIQPVLDILEEWLVLMILTFLIIDLNIVAGCLMGFYIFSLLYSELYSWIYAFKHKRKELKL